MSPFLKVMELKVETQNELKAIEELVNRTKTAKEKCIITYVTCIKFPGSSE